MKLIIFLLFFNVCNAQDSIKSKIDTIKPAIYASVLYRIVGSRLIRVIGCEDFKKFKREFPKYQIDKDILKQYNCK